MSERCANCDKPIAREGEHVGGREGSTRYYTCAAHDWRAEAMRLRIIAKATIEVLTRIARESDWCPLCDQHPSSGHAKDCALASRSDDGENK